MAHSPLGSFLISSCFIAQSAAAILALASASALAAGALAAGAGFAGAEFVLGAGLAAVSALSLFLQALRNTTGRIQQISLRQIFIDAPSNTRDRARSTKARRIIVRRQDTHCSEVACRTSAPWWLYVAQLCCLAQRFQRIGCGYEFVRDIAFEPSVCDRPHYAIPLHLLRSVELVASGNTAGMKMANPLDVLSNRLDQIAFHDLHVVDVVKKFYVRRVHFAHNAHAPSRVVAHVIVMIALAVEQLEADRDAMIFRNFLHAIQAGDGVASTFVVRQPGTIS